MIEINEDNLNIRNIIGITAKVLNLNISDDQVSEVAERLEEEVKPENRATLKFQGHYVRYCKEHPFSATKISGEKHIWECVECGNPMTLMPAQELEKIRNKRLDENLSQKEQICKKLGLDPYIVTSKEIYEKLAETIEKR